MCTNIMITCYVCVTCTYSGVDMHTDHNHHTFMFHKYHGKHLSKQCKVFFHTYHGKHPSTLEIPDKKCGDTETAERGRSVPVMRARYRSAGLTPHQRGWTEAG